MIARVLLADDDEMCRRALSNSLSRAGFEVRVVDDGAPAIELSEKVPFEIVIADLNMKAVGGLAVVRHYKARFGLGVFCVVLSGENDDEVRDACYAAGADEVIQKPATAADLRARLISAALALRGNAA